MQEKFILWFPFNHGLALTRRVLNNHALVTALYPIKNSVLYQKLASKNKSPLSAQNVSLQYGHVILVK